MGRTIQVRLEPDAIDILHQFAPNLSEAVRVMKSKTTQSLVFDEPYWKRMRSEMDKAIENAKRY